MTTVNQQKLEALHAQACAKANNWGLGYEEGVCSGLAMAIQVLATEQPEQPVTYHNPALHGNNQRVGGIVPEHAWHLSDAHGMAIIHGNSRWLDHDGDPNNRFTHSELEALVNHLNNTGFTTY